MDAKKVLPGLLGVVVAAVGLWSVFNKQGNEEELIRAALVREGCTAKPTLGNPVSSLSRHTGNGRRRISYTTREVNACGADWLVEVADGRGTTMHVTSAKQKPK